MWKLNKKQLRTLHVKKKKIKKKKELYMYCEGVSGRKTKTFA